MSLLPDAETFRRLVDGTTRGPAATAARTVLSAASAPYRLAVAARTLAYDHRWLRISSAPVPVVSVGNLTLGGTGKSPLVGWLARTLSDAGRRPAIVSRGYAARGGTCLARSRASDEGREFALTLPHVPHLAHPLRLRAALEAAACHAADVVVLDDGFQHRRLARDLEIVAVDATDPLGGGRLFPRGLLREPVGALRRADCIVLTRCDRVDPNESSRIRTELERSCGGLAGVTWVESCHAPAGLRSVDGTLLQPSFLEGRRVLAVCGIGNPRQFRRGLEDLGAVVADHLEFADHHPYRPADAAAMLRRAVDSRSELIVTTLKDLVKIDPAAIIGVPLLALEVRLRILSGEDDLRGRLLEAVGPKAARPATTSSSRRGGCASADAGSTS
jgi:tetraacyldisaccharide 4'-kinase